MTINTSPEAIAAITDGVTLGPWELRGRQTVGVGINTVAKCGWKNGRKDAPFIAASRQLVPALAAENATLRAENERLRLLLRDARDWDWIEFADNCDNEEYLACVSLLVDLNAKIDAALKGAANG